MLAFRNVRGDPADPVESWPYEGLVAAMERGGFRDWQRVAAAIERDPWGEVAADVLAYLSYEQPYGVGPLMTSVSRPRGRMHRTKTKLPSPPASASSSLKAV